MVSEWEWDVSSLSFQKGTPPCAPEVWGTEHTPQETHSKHNSMPSGKPFTALLGKINYSN